MRQVSDCETDCLKTSDNKIFSVKFTHLESTYASRYKYETYDTDPCFVFF